MRIAVEHRKTGRTLWKPCSCICPFWQSLSQSGLHTLCCYLCESCMLFCNAKLLPMWIMQVVLQC